MKIKITTDSTADLSKELLEKYNISTVPAAVILGDEEFLDGVNISPSDIFAYVKKTGQLPKTAANSAYNYKEFFEGFLKEYDAIIHVGISSDLSAGFNNAVQAASELKNVYLIDSRSLSSGIALLPLKAHDLLSEGKTLEETIKIVSSLANKVQASFVVETLEYLYKGGRCSRLAMFGANLFKIKPTLNVVDGKIAVGKKYRGKHLEVVKQYVKETIEENKNRDLSRCFITHSKIEEEIANAAIEIAKEAGFKEVLHCDAGSTITCHCGAGTLGILFLNK